MATLADSLKTSSSRPLALRKRSDLSTQEQRYQGRPYWVVKEPIGLKYYRFQEEEYCILEMLDGATSLDQIKKRFEDRFAPQKITLADLQQFIGTLHRNGLVTADAAGQGRQLKRRRDERKRKERMGALANVLAIRFKGIDPQWILDKGYPYVRWFFSPVTVFLCCLMAVWALALILVQFDTFHARLPAFEEFFGPSNWLWLSIVLASTKVLHEFGHGFSCKHFGGECHEIGVMLLVLTPCLYCNVSDSWMLRSKWKRAAIGAAGMYVELVLASIATFIWWFSEPGLLNHLALRVMFICSVSTVLFNGNPLLRYDGYYILADIVEIPNLRQKASSILNRILAKWCLGMELPEEPFLPQRNQIFFALYTVASVAYRWLVLVSILFFLYKVFEPYGLQVIGQMIAAVSIGGLVLKPLFGLVKFMRTPGRMEQVKTLNLSVTLAVLTVLIAAFLAVPLPRRVVCALEIRPRDSVSVYVDVPGQLDQVHVAPGVSIKEGDSLATLTNVNLRMAVADLRRQRNEYSSRLASLKHRRFSDRRAQREIPEVEATLDSIDNQIAEKNQDLQLLDLKAPVDGVVLAPPSRRKQPAPDGNLRGWDGSLLEPINLGATVNESDLLCEIGDPCRLEAVLVIDQSDIELVVSEMETGQRVAIVLDAYPGRTFEGEITQISRADLKVAPQGLSNQAGGELATRTDASGTARPMSTSYRAKVPLDVPEGTLQVGLRGRAKVYTGYQPLGGRLWRYLSHTFHFKL